MPDNPEQRHKEIIKHAANLLTDGLEFKSAEACKNSVKVTTFRGEKFMFLLAEITDKPFPEEKENQ